MTDPSIRALLDAHRFMSAKELVEFYKAHVSENDLEGVEVSWKQTAAESGIELHEYDNQRFFAREEELPTVGIIAVSARDDSVHGVAMLEDNYHIGELYTRYKRRVEKAICACLRAEDDNNDGATLFLGAGDPDEGDYETACRNYGIHQRERYDALEHYVVDSVMADMLVDVGEKVVTVLGLHIWCRVETGASFELDDGIKAVAAKFFRRAAEPEIVPTP